MLYINYFIFFLIRIYNKKKNIKKKKNIHKKNKLNTNYFFKKHYILNILKIKNKCKSKK